MRRHFGMGHVLLVGVGLLGALALVPGGETEADIRPRAAAAVLSTAPSLERYLHSAARNEPDQPSAEEVIASVAAARVEPASPRPAVAAAAAVVPEPIVETPIETSPVRTAVNLRQDPTTSAPTLTVLKPDETVAIYEKRDGWARVRTGSGATGWVYATYLGDAPPPAPKSEVRQAKADPAPRSERRATELASLKLRTEPSRRGQVLGTVAPGTPLRVAERQPGWLRVVLPNGESGWMRVN